MAKVVANTDGYEVIGHVNIDTLAQPNLSTLRVKIKELFGRLNGTTREMYQGHIDDANQKADESFHKYLEEMDADAVTQIHTDTKIFELRGDVYIQTKVEAIALKDKKTE